MVDAASRAAGKRNFNKFLTVFWAIVAIAAGYNFSTLLMAGAQLPGLLLTGGITLVGIIFATSSILAAKKPRPLPITEENA